MFYIDFSDVEQAKHNRYPEIRWSHMLGFKYCNIGEDRLRYLWQHYAYYPWLLSTTSWISYFIFCITSSNFLLILQTFSSIQWWIFTLPFIDIYHYKRVLYSFEATYRIYMGAVASVSTAIMMYNKLGSFPSSFVTMLQMGWEFYNLSLESLPFPYDRRLLSYVSVCIGYILFVVSLHMGLFDKAFDRSISIEISWLNVQVYPSSMLSSALLNCAIFGAKGIWGLVKHPNCSIFLSEPQHIDYLCAKWITCTNKL